MNRDEVYNIDMTDDDVIELIKAFWESPDADVRSAAFKHYSIRNTGLRGSSEWCSVNG